jgi:hypothetical protein
VLTVRQSVVMPTTIMLSVMSPILEEELECQKVRNLQFCLEIILNTFGIIFSKLLTIILKTGCLN